ncbi:MAG TPA: D-alanyl-D-alanine carboxypeptidase family protein, partial [Afifellaceae bacterium]|nr:D-alanyl-D-alanine carboxypeptidase family protein [Afifellaceae bacterium]
MVRGPYLVADVTTGAVFEHHDALRPWYPASTTKMMTAYVTFRAVEAGEITLQSPVRISENAAAQPPSKMGFKPGAVLTVDNALKIIMVKSANDIALALAEAVGGSEEGFARRMNAEARRLGMSRSRFVNPHGLPDPRQVTTARDMALLARALLLELPQYRSYYNIPAIQFGSNVMQNFNSLVSRYPGTTGMKTGFICSSGFNLVASA